MHIGKRLFPYPVLNNNKLYSQFKNGSFTLTYTEIIKDDALVIDKLFCELKSDYLLILIKNYEAELICIVECASTMFRKPYTISPNTYNKIEIPISELNGKYSISAYLVALKNFDYSSVDFCDEYNDYVFKIEKHDILAIDDGYINTINFDEDSDTKKSSIFVVIKNKNITNETMQFNYDQEKITIDLPEKEWNIYDKTKRITQFQNMYFSIIAVPALAYALGKLQSENHSIDALKIEYKWFGIFANAYSKIYGKDLDDEDFFVKEFNVYTAAQLVLNSPVTKAMNELFALTMGQQGEYDEN